MIARSVNAAADVIARAMENGCQTPAGWAMALDSVCMLQSPETAAENTRLRTERDRYRTAWRMARTRALSTGGAADRYAARARDVQEALQHTLFTVIAGQLALHEANRGRQELEARVAELEAERHSTNETLDDAATALRVQRDRVAALAERLRAGQQWQRGRTPELVSENLVSQSELREIFGIPLVAPWGDGITRRIAPTQALREDGGDSSC